MVDKDKIMALLKQYFTTTGTITISDEGLVSCTGDVHLKRELKHERLPVSFDRVDGWFLCHSNRLETLAGAPQSVGDTFWCVNNRLKSLEGAPQSIRYNFVCWNNPLLRSLEGLPVIPGTLCLSYKPKLPLLRCLLAKKVEFVPALNNTTIETILNRYAGQGEAGAFECGAELASEGFKENARW